MIAKKQIVSIEIIEALSKIVTIEADDEEQALIKAQEIYRDEQVVLGSEDYSHTDFVVKGCKDNDKTSSSNSSC
ncbi:MAG TPA: DpnD/PcfM family protein [Psychrobacter pasteurii]|nr:DpnD/PcfM family protein [Psychrobacter pasteurii]